MKKIKLAMIGYGNVGKAFGKMLKTRKQYIAETYDIEPVITAICTRRKGALLDSDGIDTDLLEDRVSVSYTHLISKKEKSRKVQKGDVKQN